VTPSSASSIASFQRGVLAGRHGCFRKHPFADLDAGYPCRHDEVYIFIVAGERKLMNYFVDNVQRTASIRLFQRGFLHRHPSVASEARKTSEQCPNLRLKAALSDLVFALILPTW
jgi:hypothetical protein